MLLLSKLLQSHCISSQQPERFSKVIACIISREIIIVTSTKNGWSLLILTLYVHQARQRIIDVINFKSSEEVHAISRQRRWELMDENINHIAIAVIVVQVLAQDLPQIKFIDVMVCS